ncbi:MAG: GntR family transcriptional regulator [Desulfobaccales bacterium]
MDRIAGHLDRESACSLYEQVTNRMRGHLDKLSVGAQVPTEAELTQIFTVGRSTIRKALQRLVDEGVLVRRQGKGTFVAHLTPKIVHSIDRTAPFMETFRANGEDLETKVIEFRLTPNPELPKELDDWRRPVLQYQRLYISKGVPHAITQVFLPYDIGREISQAEIEANPTYSVLRNRGIEPARSEFLVSCRQPSSKISRILELSQSAFLLVLERITRDQDGRPVEMTTHFLRPDVYQLSVVLKDNLATSRRDPGS